MAHNPSLSGANAAPADEGYPTEFVERIHSLIGPEADACLQALADPPTGLRVNTLRLTPAEFARISPFGLEPLPFPPSGFLVDPEARPGKHPYHAAGLYYLQDPGAMAVATLLAPEPGERVLDLAAAPGGKATHLAALLGDDGLLVANDVHAGRARELAGNLERMGVRNAVVTNESVDRLAGHFGAFFDRVLLDAPCSGESMFHKSSAAREAWSPAAVLGCARRQSELLDAAAALVRPGGTLVYSTCTFGPEENEAVVARFVKAHAGFELISLPAVPGAEPGEPAWVDEELRDAALHRTVRLWPKRVPGAGHFVAGLRRRDGADEAPRRDPEPKLGRQQRALFAAFADEYLADSSIGSGRLLQRGSELYALPESLPALGRLRVERPGLWLGTLHANRFEPSHALALWLRATEATSRLEVAHDGPEVSAYLRGETLRRPGPAGWVLVTVGGFALGWGKRVGETVKNHYPKGLRRA
jgi:NOL1/NOP2/sun family putative RNA methylase